MAHLHLVQRLIVMNGAVSLLGLYAFMVRTSAAVPSNSVCTVVKSKDNELVELKVLR